MSPQKIQRSLSVASRSKTTQSGERISEPAATFEIESEFYAVCYPGRTAKASAGHSNDAANGPNGQVVGELKTKRGRFLIISRGSASEADRDPAQRSVEVLTRRELQIATLVAEGRVNKEIAGQLAISEWTVSTHLRRMFAKLRVDSRAALVFRCFGRNHFRGGLL